MPAGVATGGAGAAMPGGAATQGLTLVHLSAQRKHFPWDKGCSRSFRGCWGAVWGVFVAGGAGVASAFRGCFEFQKQLRLS